jgi:exodeoxyribonuclease-3
MRIATWNINGVRARIDGLRTWLREASPDIVCLQEIKTQDEAFPAEELESEGYNLAVFGEKGFNGVAILSKLPFDDVRRGLPGDGSDAQARYIEASFTVGERALIVASIYLPNGNPIGTDKFSYKLDWMKRLDQHASSLLELEIPIVLAGDYNVIPTAADARNAKDWLGDALFQPQSRDAFDGIVYRGFTDAVRACRPEPELYTFWDYQAGAWNKNNGIRIDHLLLSCQATDLLESAEIDKHTRGWEKPSDHVPVRIDLAM